MADPTIEDVAKKMGWNPNHDPDSGRPYVSAEEFILRGRDIQKTMGTQLQEQDRKIEAVTQQNTQLLEGMKNLTSHYKRLTKADGDRAKAQIEQFKQQRDQAIDDGDKDKVAALDGQIREAENIVTEAEAAEQIGDQNTQAQQQTQMSAIAEQWKKDNPWYGTDVEMTNYIDVQAERFKGLPDDKYFAQLTRTAREMYPDRFTTTQKRQQSVEGDSSLRTAGDQTTKSYSFADLTPEQQGWARFYEKQGVMSIQEYIEDLAKINSVGV